MSDLADHGKQPYVIDIEADTKRNSLFRVTKWTGRHLQMTLMSIPPGGDIGLEVHEKSDQFLRLEQGQGRCEMGPAKDRLDFVREVKDDFAIFVPAGTWHNVTNTGDEDMRLYAIYAVPDHAPGTVHRTKADAKADPNEH